MELSDVVGAQFAFHGIAVGFVVILAVLVFIFGFKTAEEPPFNKLTSSDDRKPAGKKRKVKDKKSQSNGHVTALANDKSDSKQKSNDTKVSTPKTGGKASRDEKREVSVKETSKSGGKQEKKQQKVEIVVKTALKENKNNKENKAEQKSIKKNEQTNKDTKKQANNNKGKENIAVAVKVKNNKGKENVAVKVKNNNKGKENVAVEVKNKDIVKRTQKLKKGTGKPVDDEEGEWEQAIYRKDKKKNRVANAENATGAPETDKKESASPGKKKSAKTVVAPVTETTESDAEKKIIKKEAVKKEKTENTQPNKDASESTDNDKTTTKKNKKKEGKNGTENNGVAQKTVVVEKVAEVSKVVTAPKVVAPAPKVPDPANIIKENIAFDDFADSCPEKWKEPKTSKKSNNKKKVRKDQ